MSARLLPGADDVPATHEDAPVGGGLGSAGRNGGHGQNHDTDDDGGAKTAEHLKGPFKDSGTEETAEHPGWLADIQESDVQLVQRYQEGDVDAFACLYQRHSTAVRNVCRARLRDPALAEDAVQETFARALTALPEFADGALIGRWLKRVAANHCKDVLRRHERRNVPLDDRAAAIPDFDSESAYTGYIQRDAVTGVLRALPTRDADLLVAHHVNDEPIVALAQRWGQTTNAMKVTLHRARARFREVSVGALGVGPVGIVRRWWRDSSWAVRQADGAAATMASLQVAVVQIVVTVGLVGGSPAMAATLVGAVAVHDTHVVAAAGEVPTSVGRGRAVRVAGHAPELVRATPRRSAAVAEDTTRPSRTAPVQIAPVDVPVAEKRVAQSRMRKPAYEYGVTIKVGDSELSTGYETDVKDEHDPAHQLACTGAQASPALTYCTR